MSEQSAKVPPSAGANMQHPAETHWPKRLIHLLIRPRKYFGAPDVEHKNTILFFAFAAGLAYVLPRILSFAQITLAMRRPATEGGLVSEIAHSWPTFWVNALLLGLVAAVVWYFLCGWWYKKRLHWSGATEATPTQARHLYVQQQFVEAAPWIILVITQSLTIASTPATLSLEGFLISLTLIAAIWSCWVSYIGASTRFAVKKWRAIALFFALPALQVFLTQVGLVAQTQKAEQSFSAIHQKPATENAKVAKKLLARTDKVPPTHLYELARRLWPTDKAAAMEWLAVGMVRARYDAMRCADPTARQGIMFLPNIAPEVIDGVQADRKAFGEAGLRALQRPDLLTDKVSPAWICNHGMDAITDTMAGKKTPEEKMFVPAPEWPAIRQKILADVKTYFEQQGLPQADPRVPPSR